MIVRSNRHRDTVTQRVVTGREFRSRIESAASTFVRKHTTHAQIFVNEHLFSASAEIQHSLRKSSLRIYSTSTDVRRNPHSDSELRFVVAGSTFFKNLLTMSHTIQLAELHDNNDSPHSPSPISNEVLMNHTDEMPEGGYGWVVVASCSMIMCVHF